LGHAQQRRTVESHGGSRPTDKNIRYQQNLAGRVIAIVVLGNSRWPLVQRHVDRVVAAIDAAKPGTYTEVEIPNR